MKFLIEVDDDPRGNEVSLELVTKAVSFGICDYLMDFKGCFIADAKEERIAELEAENANLHDWIDSYCGQPDQTHLLKEFNRRIAELEDQVTALLTLCRDDERRIAALEELLEKWMLYYTDGLPDDELRELYCDSVDTQREQGDEYM